MCLKIMLLLVGFSVALGSVSCFIRTFLKPTIYTFPYIPFGLVGLGIFLLLAWVLAIL